MKMFFAQASCPESTFSAVYVESCPRTVDERREAGNRKNCKQIAHSCTSFEYHCVINAWKNGTLEVCAPSQQIIGKISSLKCHKFVPYFKKQMKLNNKT